MEVSGSLDKKTADDRDDRLWARARINAAGRLEQAMMAVEMLTTDRSGPGATRSRCSSTAATSGARRSNARSLTKPRRCSRPRVAWATAGRSCWDDKGWHAGVIGIVAGRLAEALSSADRDHRAGRGDLPRLGALDSRDSTCTKLSKTARKD